MNEFRQLRSGPEILKAKHDNSIIDIVDLIMKSENNKFPIKNITVISFICNKITYRECQILDESQNINQTYLYLVSFRFAKVNRERYD